MGNGGKRYVKGLMVLLVLLLFLLEVSAISSETVVMTDRQSYNPWDVVHIVINDSSDFTATVFDPVGGATILGLVPTDTGYTAQYSASQGVVLGTYTVLVDGSQINEAAQFDIRTLSINPDFKSQYPLGNITLPGTVLDASSGLGINATLDLSINDEIFTTSAVSGNFTLNYTADTPGPRTVVITATDDENITGTTSAGFEVYSIISDNLSISTSQQVYEAGQKVDISVTSPYGTPTIWVTDPLGDPMPVDVIGKNGIYSGTLGLDNAIILGQYWAEAEVIASGSHVKVGFELVAPIKPFGTMAAVSELESGVDFSRQLSGHKVGQHKVPPIVNIQVTVSAEVSSPVSNASFVDYYPAGWTITDPDGGTLDTDMNTITWDVGDVDSTVSRTYTIFSPQRTMPSTKYDFMTRLAYDTMSEMSKDWMVVVSDPDSVDPVIDSISDAPDPVNQGNNISITAILTDNVGVGSVWVDIDGINYSMTEYSDSYLTTAIIGGTNQTAVFVKDGTFVLIDMKESSMFDNTKFYLTFTDKLINNSVLRIYAKMNRGKPVSIFDSSDLPLFTPLGSFTVTSGTGAWYNVTLNILTPTDTIWLGASYADNHREYFDYIYATDAMGSWKLDYNTTGLNPGIHNYTVYANDTSGNNASGMTGNFTIQAVTPTITGVTATPDPQVINYPVNITANITDDLSVHTAYINITLPNATSTGNLSMTKNGGDIWYYNYTPSIGGQYNFTIYANDTADNWATPSTSNFTAQTPPNLTFSLTPESISNNIQTKITLNVTNLATVQADSITINLTVPNEFSYPSIISNGGIFNDTTSNITWTLANLPGGSSTYFTFWSRCSEVNQFNFTANATYKDLNSDPYNSTADLPVTIRARIAVYNGTGANLTSVNNIITKLQMWGYAYAEVDSNDLNNNLITTYDLLIIGSGSSDDMDVAMSGAGLENIQTFVENGGGFIGFGAYGGGGTLLAGSGGGLILTTSKIKTRPIIGQASIMITDTNHPVNDGYSGEVTIEFSQGSYITLLPASATVLSGYYENLGGISISDWKKLIQNPSSITDQAGEGLVALFGWELLADNSPDTDIMFENAINWAIRKNVKVTIDPVNFTIHRNETKQVNISVSNDLTYNVTGTLRMVVPTGWTAKNGSLGTITFDLDANETKNYLFNVTSSPDSFHVNYTLWAYATYQGRVSQDSTIAQIIGPSVTIQRNGLEYFINPETNSTITLTINNSASAEETARNLTVTEMVPSSWQVNPSSITPGATTWTSQGISYIQWNLSNLTVGSQTNVSYEVRSPIKLLRYNFRSIASYLDEYNTRLESGEYHQVTVVASLSLQTGTLIVPMDDKQSGNSTLNGYPRQLVAYGFLCNISVSIPTLWAIQDVSDSLIANTTNVWNSTAYPNETFSSGPFILANLNSTERDLAIQTAAYYNIILHNTTDTLDVKKGIVIAPPTIAYFSPIGDPEKYNNGHEDVILNNSLIGFTYVDIFDVLGGSLDNYATLIVPSGSLHAAGPMEPDVIDRIYDWVEAGGNLWVQDEAAYEMVKYTNILDLTTEHFQRGGYGNLTTGNNLTIAMTHVVTQTYGQVMAYTGWYEIISDSEYSRQTLVTLDTGSNVLIFGKQGSGEIYVTTLELFDDYEETASNTQGRRLIDNFVFVATYRSAAELDIIGTPPGVVAYPGYSTEFNISVRNVGAILLNNVTLRLNSTLNSSWVNITPNNYTYLDINEIGVFTINITLPPTATPEYILGYLEADSLEGASDSDALSLYISNLIVKQTVDYYNNLNQVVNITINVTDMSLVPTNGTDVDLTLTAPDYTKYYLSASELGGGQYFTQFNDAGQIGTYLVETNATKGSSLGYNYTYFRVDFLRVNFSFYSDSGYTTPSRDFEPNEVMYAQIDVDYSNYNNVSGALGNISVTSPNGTVYVVPVTETSSGVYRGSFSNTQIGGSYQFSAIATDTRSITGSDADTLSLPMYSSFPPGTLVIPMDSQQNTGAAGGQYPSQISAYGLVHWLLANDIPVDWVIMHDKAYQGRDFNATTDNDASNATGTILDRNYSSGPFLIRDPDTSTSWNEAWSTIQQIRTASSRYNDVVIHELNQTLNVETRDDYVLDRPARIAILDGNDVRIQYLWSTASSPTAAMNMTLLTPAQIQNGVLLTNETINCTKRKVYDWIFFGDSNFYDSVAFPDSMFTQLDMFVNKTGNVHLQGLGATMNTRTSWLTQGIATYEDDDYPNNQPQPYSVFNQTADHPLGQTSGTPTLDKTNGNRFDSFEHDNNWLPNTLFLAGFKESSVDNSGNAYTWDRNVKIASTDSVSGNSEDDYTFVAANTRGGVISAIGNREQTTTPEMRLALNSVLFSVVTPQFDHNVNYPEIPNGGTSNLTLTGTVDSGMLVYNLKVYDELPSYVTPDISSITLSVDGNYTYYVSNNTLFFNLGNPNQTAIQNGTLFSYNITVAPSADLPKDLILLNSTQVYDDNWNTAISSSHSITVQTTNNISVMANKSIASGTLDNYTVTLNLTNLMNFNQANVSIFDLVPDNFTIVNPVPNYNGSQNNRYYWTMNLTAGESKTITYTLAGTGRYNIRDAFIVGVDPK